ncbi:peptidoglycan-binding protein [Streptomyces massasporeus]|uniref:peptidoglycan-binding protein n=1 Tax=Streptomyces massasporeus TaxID=67324 RepID=UPI0033CD8B55
MEPPNGHPCPECGAPRQRDNTPACACTHRAAEALRDARTAQAAAAEDFDPLRIRPYVEIDAGASGGPGGGTAPSADAVEPTPHALDDAALRPGTGPAQAAPAQGPAATTGTSATPPYGAAPQPTGNGSAETSATQGQGEPAAEGTPDPAAASDSAGSLPHTEAPRPGVAAPRSPADATMPLRPVDPDATAVLPAASATSALPAPLAPAATEPSVTDLRMFDGTAGADRGAAEAGGPGARRPGRRRRNLLVVAAAACVAVVAAAGYASGLFSYESPSRDTALPDDIRASVPDAPSSSAASTPPQGSTSAASPAPAAPPSPSRGGSPSASPSPSAPSASASPSQSPSPSAPQPSGSATGPEQAPPDNGRQKTGPTVLRLGDRGPEVTELQLRLRQLYLYDDDTDGTFDDRLADAVRTYQWSRGVQTDELGVYDRETREKLESETREP